MFGASSRPVIQMVMHLAVVETTSSAVEDRKWRRMVLDFLKYI